MRKKKEVGSEAKWCGLAEERRGTRSRKRGTRLRRKWGEAEKRGVKQEKKGGRGREPEIREKGEAENGSNGKGSRT